MKNKDYQVPKIKKNLRNFLNEEEGRISKKSIKKIGLALITIGMASGGFMKADPSLAGTCNCCNVQCGSHASHCSHGSHGSHASHASHASHGSHGSHNSW